MILPVAIIITFLASGVYALGALPNGLMAGFSYSNGAWSASGMEMSTGLWLAISGIFILATAFKAPIISIMLLAVHLLFLMVNIP